MSQGQKIFTSTLWCIVVLLMVGLIASWTSLGQGDHAVAEAKNVPGVTTDFPDTFVPPFSLTDQASKPFTETSLAGHPWIIDFIFTRCTGPCPMMTEHMAGLQKELKDTPVRFLSISVDPHHDTPEVFAQYARDHGADTSSWSFVTGDQNAIFTLARKLLIGVTPASGEVPIIHNTKMLLVDSTGQVRGYYNSTEAPSLKALSAAARELGAGKARAAQ